MLALAITACDVCGGCRRKKSLWKIHPHLHFVGVYLHLHRVHFPSSWANYICFCNSWACQPSRNGRDCPGVDPRCPVSRARLILSRKCENWPPGMDIWLFTNECIVFCIVFVSHTRFDLTWLECNVTDYEIVIMRLAANTINNDEIQQA